MSKIDEQKLTDVLRTTALECAENMETGSVAVKMWALQKFTQPHYETGATVYESNKSKYAVIVT